MEIRLLNEYQMTVNIFWDGKKSTRKLRDDLSRLVLSWSVSRITKSESLFLIKQQIFYVALMSRRLGGDKHVGCLVKEWRISHTYSSRRYLAIIFHNYDSQVSMNCLKHASNVEESKIAFRAGNFLLVSFTEKEIPFLNNGLFFTDKI